MIRIRNSSYDLKKFGKKTSRLSFFCFVNKILMFAYLIDRNYCLSGPVFIQPSDIQNREQLIVTTKCSYEREVFKRDGPSTQVKFNQIQGKCSVLSLKHFCTRKNLSYLEKLFSFVIVILDRLTEISESHVYVCESKYFNDDHSIRNLSKPLKRISLSSKATADEIWTYRKELLLKQDASSGLFKLVDESAVVVEFDDQSTMDVDDQHNNSMNLNSSFSNRYNNNGNGNGRKSNRRVGPSRPISGYLVFASDARKRLAQTNPGLSFADIGRIIGDQWRRLPQPDRERYDERARERTREQEMQAVQNETPHTPQRIVNGGVAINGYYQNIQPINGGGILPILLKPPPPPPVQQQQQQPQIASVHVVPPRVQRVAHSETYSRYIDHLKTDHPFSSDWPKQLKATIGSNGNHPARTLPSHWLINNSPGFYNNMYEALWSMRENMWTDMVRPRNVLSDEW